VSPVQSCSDSLQWPLVGDVQVCCVGLCLCLQFRASQILWSDLNGRCTRLLYRTKITSLIPSNRNYLFRKFNEQAYFFNFDKISVCAFMVLEQKMKECELK